MEAVKGKEAPIDKMEDAAIRSAIDEANEKFESPVKVFQNSMYFVAGSIAFASAVCAGVTLGVGCKVVRNHTKLLELVRKMKNRK